MPDSTLENKFGFVYMFSDSLTDYDRQNALDSLFARAYKDELRNNEEFYTSAEWARIEAEDNRKRARLGAKKFKRKALGFFGAFAVKSLDELAKDLFDVGVVKSLQEGKELVPYLNGKKVIYSKGLSGLSLFKIRFDEVLNKEGEKRYQVKQEIYPAY